MFYLLLQINNAGILDDPSEVNLDIAKSVLATNYFAVKNVTKTLFPLLRDDTPGGARVIVVASRLGQLKVTCMFHNKFKKGSLIYLFLHSHGILNNFTPSECICKE
jgi:hypothetical protein